MPEFEHTAKVVGNDTEVRISSNGFVALYLSAEDAEALVERPWSTEAIDLNEQVKQAYRDAKVTTKSYTGTAKVNPDFKVAVYNVTVEDGGCDVKVERTTGMGPYVSGTLLDSLITALTEAREVVEHNKTVRGF